ncbi:MAG: Na-translocating system protein MpsB, partial [Chloroflexi bacterium]|nr:Na-translocating system protein MpsB [Chloroflexota bacterium]
MHLSITGEMRDHLTHEVEHVSHLLSSQGPIGTFIHHNTLHGLQHLPFEEAVAEAQRVLGGRGYLPNEEYRRFYAAGRITDEDINVAIRGRPSLTAGGRLTA